MNRKIPLLPTTLFLLCVIFGIFFYTYSIGKIIPTTVQQIVEDTDGTIWTVFGDSLIDISDRRPNKEFSQHGFDYHVGQLVSLQSGEWILNVGPQSGHFMKSIYRSLRDNSAEFQASGSLIKCNSSIEICAPWGEVELQFERAFEGVELDSGNLLLFKPEQKRIFLVDSNGIILDENDDEEIWFGVNQTSKGRWIGVNTDRKIISEVRLNGNEFSIERVPFDFKELDGDVEKIFLPPNLVESDGEFWGLGTVISTLDDVDLEFTDILDSTPSLLSFDIETGDTTLYPYKFGADAEMEKIGSTIYFSDFEKYEIKKFDLISKKITLVESQNLDLAYQEDIVRISIEKDRIRLWLVLIGALALMAFSWVVVRSKPVASEDGDIDLDPDVETYGSSARGFQRELTQVAKVFSKHELTRAEAAGVSGFKKIDNHYIYYPNGYFSKGRIVPDAETLVGLYKYGERCRRNSIRWVVLPLIGAILSPVAYWLNSYAGLLLVIFSMAVLVIGALFVSMSSWRRKRKLIDGLIEHNSRWKITDVMNHIAKKMRRWEIVLLILGGLSLMILSVFSLADTGLTYSIENPFIPTFLMGLLALLFWVRIYQIKNDSGGK